MNDRTSPQHTYMLARNAAGSRATGREFDDDHLVQQVKKADVFHSETPSNFERFQPIGLTSFPLKQQEEQQQSTQQPQQEDGQGNWNHSQPKGPACEIMMNYLNGSRSHPVAGICDDRRVRPYGMSEGEGALYAPDGSEQMVLFKDTMTRVMSLDNKSVKDKETKTRFASLAHVEKKMQTHKIEENQQQGGQQQQQEKYKHEGDSVNTEVRCTKDRIEFRAGDDVVGYYEKSSKTWYLTGTIVKMEASDHVSTIGNTYLGADDNSKMKQVHRKTDMDSDGDPAIGGAQKVWAL